MELLSIFLTMKFGKRNYLHGLTTQGLGIYTCNYLGRLLGSKSAEPSLESRLGILVNGCKVDRVKIMQGLKVQVVG